LTTDQYVTHREQREKLFERLVDIGSTNAILFVGHSLKDPDIRQILQEISLKTKSRTRYYAVFKDFISMEQRLWESKKITLIKGTFEEFLNTLNEEISTIEREVVFKPKSHEIERKFISNDSKVTEETLNILNNKLTYVTPNLNDDVCDPKMFYHGFSKGWSPIMQDFDCRRRLTDEILSQIILVDEVDRNNDLEVYLISGSAGSGKTVILKRIAWDSAKDYDKICLYWSSDDRLHFNSIIDIADKVGERIFLFVDKISTHVHDFRLLVDRLSKANVKITCIITERTNEWNSECKPLHNLITDVFPLHYLSIKEIKALLEKLDKYKSLGVLEGKSEQEKINAFHDKAGRQLLIALHEATLAKPFIDIIYDEYQNIYPEKAKLIYQTICVMNRIDVPVRAGIINRIHGVGFKEFRDDFFAPLENVVKTVDYGVAYDKAYISRHPWIAEMVFTQSLKKEQDRYDIYINLISALDIGYSSDRTAFRELIKYRSLKDLFRDPNNINSIYESAHHVCGNDDYYYQQLAIFNMKKSTPNYSEAERLLSLAEKFGRHNRSIAHTKAELELSRAHHSTGIEKEIHYNKAANLAGKLTGKNSESSHGYDTLFKVEVAKLKDAIISDDNELIAHAVKKCEAIIKESLQIYHDDEVMLSEDAKLATLLSDSERAMKSLKKAFKINSNSTYIGTSLTKILLKKGDTEEAIKILTTLLENNNNDKVAHSEIAKIFSLHYPLKTLDAEYHWQRSFTKGDSNYSNQLWYARQLYINNKFPEYMEMMEHLKQLRLPPITKHSVRGILIDNNNVHINVIGKCVQKESTFAIFESDKYKGKHFLFKQNCSDAEWRGIEVNKVSMYNLGFTFSGTAAIFKSKLNA
tara:strand:- start:493 stop:3090 length:2598 start_codon:yes stop_codon:yes gene_type:complete